MSDESKLPGEFEKGSVERWRYWVLNTVEGLVEKTVELEAALDAEIKHRRQKEEMSEAVLIESRQTWATMMLLLEQINTQLKAAAQIPAQVTQQTVSTVSPQGVVTQQQTTTTLKRFSMDARLMKVGKIAGSIVAICLAWEYLRPALIAVIKWLVAIGK